MPVCSIAPIGAPRSRCSHCGRAARRRRRQRSLQRSARARRKPGHGTHQLHLPGKHQLHESALRKLRPRIRTRAARRSGRGPVGSPLVRQRRNAGRVSGHAPDPEKVRSGRRPARIALRAARTALTEHALIRHRRTRGDQMRHERRRFALTRPITRSSVIARRHRSFAKRCAAHAAAGKEQEFKPTNPRRRFAPAPCARCRAGVDTPATFFQPHEKRR